MKDRIRILIADDRVLMREGLRSLIETQPDFAVVAEAADGAEAVSAVQTSRPDVALLDVSMPGANGIETARRLSQAAGARLGIVAYSMYTDPCIVTEVLGAGASTFLPKGSSFDDLVSAIRRASAGGNRPPPQPPAKTGGAAALLSAREVEVLVLIAEGRTTRQIATDLHISVKTVESHRRNIQEKLGISTVAGLTRYAISRGMTAL
jgi:DNA-binding NarL/FixJ family response regulator